MSDEINRKEPKQEEGERIEPSQDARNWAMACHLAPVLGVALSAGLLGFAGPLVIWLAKRGEFPYVDDQGREALNFQLTLLILTIVCVALAFVTCGWLGILVFVPLVVQVVFAVLATVAASRGETYRYPFNLRIVK